MADSEQYKTVNEAAQDAADSAKRAEDALAKAEEILKQVRELADSKSQPPRGGRNDEKEERKPVNEHATTGAGRGEKLHHEKPTGQPPAQPVGHKIHDTPFKITFTENDTSGMNFDIEFIGKTYYSTPDFYSDQLEFNETLQIRNGKIVKSAVVDYARTLHPGVTITSITGWA